MKKKNKEIKFKKVVEKLLSSNEEIRYQFSFGEWYLKIKKIIAISFGSVLLLSAGLLINHFFKVDIIILILIIGVLLVLLIIVSLIYFDWYLKRANIYLITNKRIIIHKGWLFTYLKSIDFQQITDIKVIQSFIDKIIFKTGTLKINTAGTQDYEIALSCVENPHKIKTIIIEVKDLIK
jgi:membrane protein YdbS with pleckstrin-like domain